MIIKIREYLEQQGCEPQRDFPDTAFPDTAFPDGENPPLRKQIIKKTNNKENNTCKHVEDEDKNEISFGVEFSKKETQPKNDKITIRQFDLFWKIYPKKTDKGKALSKWAEICNRKDKNRIPTWKEIKRAIYAQKKTPRWQKVDKDGKALYIPLPTTWLNKSRWLDDPAEMVTFDFQNNNTNARANGYTDDGLANALQNVKTNIHK